MSIVGVTNINSIITATITTQEKNDIKNYLLGAVNCWCKNCLGINDQQQLFGVSELVGTVKSNDPWTSSPLLNLHQWHLNNNQNNNINLIMSEAAKDAGVLLKEVLFYDSRDFDRTQSSPRKYVLL